MVDGANRKEQRTMAAKTFEIPYENKSLTLEIQEKNLKAVLIPPLHRFKAEAGEAALVENALRRPLGQQPLAQLAKGKRDIVLVTSDHTRAMPSRITLPLLLKEIRSVNQSARITILIATGLHRAPTEAELRHMFGDAIVDNERIVANDAFRPGDFVSLCTLPSGASFEVNRLAAECDLLVAEGFVEPHFFAGFSGGRKSILPGICSEVTVNENHSFPAIADPHATAGVLEGNPIHKDMICAARKANLQFILNVALNEEKKIIAAFAGDMEQAHDEAVAFVRKLSGCPAVKGDIIFTSAGGYPLDQNLYQTPKAASTAEACANADGVIIICASCCDGLGGVHFEKLIQMGSPREIEAKLAAIPPKQTIPEQWCAQIYARILQKHTIILVSDLPDEVVRSANMVPAASPAAALALAYEKKGPSASVVLIPDGVATLVEK